MQFLEQIHLRMVEREWMTSRDWLGTIIHLPYFPHNQDSSFSFAELYDKLNTRGYCIYPGKVTKNDSFRIGNIGQLYPADMRALLKV